MSGLMSGARSIARDFVRSLSPSIYQRLRRLRRSPSPPAGPDPLPAWGSTVTIDGITMRIDERMSEFNIRKLIEGRHTLHERRLLARTLEPDDVVMELGGGIGMVAIACAKATGPGRVFSYEPNPVLESLARDNYSLNGVEPQLRMCMLGPEAGRREFHVSERFSRSSIYDTDGRGTTVIEVPVLSFNEEVTRIRPTVLIVDIQGGEVELFKYADLDTVRKLLLETHAKITGTDAAEAIGGRLREMGFVEDDHSGQLTLYVRRPEPTG